MLLIPLRAGPDEGAMICLISENHKDFVRLAARRTPAPAGPRSAAKPHAPRIIPDLIRFTPAASILRSAMDSEPIASMPRLASSIM